MVGFCWPSSWSTSVVAVIKFWLADRREEPQAMTTVARLSAVVTSPFKKDALIKHRNSVEGCDVKAHDAELLRVSPGHRPRCSGQGVGSGRMGLDPRYHSIGTVAVAVFSSFFGSC